MESKGIKIEVLDSSEAFLKFVLLGEFASLVMCETSFPLM